MSTGTMLTPEELAHFQMMEKQRETEEQLVRVDMMKIPNVNENHRPRMFCRHCRSNVETYDVTKQTRRGDEGPNVYFYCSKCHNQICASRG